MVEINEILIFLKKGIAMKKKVSKLFLLFLFSHISANANTISVTLRVVMPDVIQPQIIGQSKNSKITNATTFIEDTTKDGIPAIIETTIVK